MKKSPKSKQDLSLPFDEKIHWDSWYEHQIVLCSKS